MIERIDKFSHLLMINSKLVVLVERGEYEGAYDSRLEDLDDDGSLLIALPSQGGVPVPLLPGTKIGVHFLAIDSRYKFTTEVSNKEKRGELPMLKLKAPEYLQREQLRNFYRVPTRVRGFLSILEKNTEDEQTPKYVGEYDCVVVDLSGGGCRLLCDVDIDRHQKITIDISTALGKDVILYGEVVRTIRIEGKFQVSVNFIFNKEVERNPVIKYVMRRQIEMKQLQG